MSTKLISINPANNSINGEVNFSTREEIQEKIQKAHAAKLSWKLLGAKKRAELLRPLIPAFKSIKNNIALLTTQEMGKPITQALGDVDSDFDYLEHFLNSGPDYLQDEITYKNKECIHKIMYEPRGVVASIAPWNYPFSNFLWSVIPQLVAGNTVVFKHSEHCPLLGKLFEKTLLSIHLPEGVFSEIYGDGSVGDYLVQQDINLIWFIGSSRTGKKLCEIAGKKQIKAILEMGGSNPAIIFEDVDLNKILLNLYNNRFTNCGQVCDAVKRVIIHESLYDNFISQFSELIQKLIIGDPSDPHTQIGPLASMGQLELLESQVQDAVDKGANVIIGGSRISKYSGAYYSPTLITDIKPNMRIWNEEVFGPVLPIVSFKTEEEAVKLANKTPYGLGAHVYSNNTIRAQKIARLLDAGFVDINNGSHWNPCTPFGGVKASGMGCEHGRNGFQELCQIKVVAEG